MKTRTIFDPSIYEPDHLVKLIENTPDAFTEGRRNNDMVNWFLAKRAADSRQDYLAIEADFEAMIELKWPAKMNSLYLFHWEEKIQKLYRSYRQIHQPSYLYSLWLPMEYTEDIHEDQLVFTGTGPVED
jgi:hypothetical protein